MKRLFLSTLVVLAIATAVVGCTSDSTTSSSNTPGLTSTPASSVTELEGTWVGNSPDNSMIPTFSFRDNKLTVTFANSTETLSVRSWTFTIDSTANPKAIDMVTSGNGQTQTLLGIYELSGNRLELCLGEPDGARPTAFPNDHLVLFRQSPGNTPGITSTQTPTATSSATELEGAWKCTSFNGNALNGNMSITYTFSGNNWTRTITTPQISVQNSGTFTLDSTVNPKTLDMYMASCTDPSDSNIGETGLYIYQLSGTNLTLVGADDSFVRPTSFTDGLVFVLIKQ